MKVLHSLNIFQKCKVFFIAVIFALSSFTAFALAGEQPVAIFHAFDQAYIDVELYACELSNQGYSHVQIAPAQKSNPSDQWWARYQPIDYTVIKGKGSEGDLKKLIKKAHSCGMKVIADVVFNHMANMDEYRDLNFPGLSRKNFHSRCDIDYSNRDSVVNCWLGDLPDLNQNRTTVQTKQKKHLKKLLKLGIDGFRFDAAKHMPPDIVKKYIHYIDKESKGTTWNYLEVIEDYGTNPEDYTWIAAVTDFLLYNSMKDVFSFGGDLRSLKAPKAVDDPRSVTFGRNHDNIRELNVNAINPYSDRTDAYLATAYVLARERGTPLILNWDNYDNMFIKHGVKFRRIMSQRAKSGENVKETVLSVIDMPTVMMMERGNQGFFVVNKGTDKYNTPVLDLTLTNLEGCYRELRNNLNVAIERRDGKKYVTRWGTWDRGGLEIKGRDALYFIREPWSQCQTR